MVPSCSSFPSAPPTSSVTPAQPLASRRPVPHRMIVTMVPPRSPVPSAACGLIGYIRVSITSHVSVGRPQGGVYHQVHTTTAAPTCDSTLGPHHGWSLDQHLAPPAPEKCTDQESRSRRQNLRILNIKEGEETESKATDFIAHLLKNALSLETLSV
ncbi:hypothetical protein DPX16_15641 [Anabarilius grahami]|uniref:Uncharacterized protein n=1 Tax=Anabarilius grahami TaxID=495550 RepID=A0A3N0YT14_ANAGA|nr:hypothetical protein DPX16_15641 [Anabarilius grahami]